MCLTFLVVTRWSAALQVNKYISVCILLDTYTFIFVPLHRNLYGKRPADYAASLEMLEIFQEASEGTQYANARISHSPSASLSVVCRHDVNSPFCLEMINSGAELL